MGGKDRDKKLRRSMCLAVLLEGKKRKKNITEMRLEPKTFSFFDAIKFVFVDYSSTRAPDDDRKAHYFGARCSEQKKRPIHTLTSHFPHDTMMG